MIYLVRHGETELNRQKRFQGRNNWKLTALGESQAASIGEVLRKELQGSKFVLHVSPLGRTRQTAEIVAGQIECPEPLFDWRILHLKMPFSSWTKGV